MAGERREDDRVEGRRDRRAAGAKRVGRRAGGRGDDDAVAGEREHRLAVDLDAQPSRPGSRHACDDNIVESDHAEGRFRLRRGRGALRSST